MSHKFFTNTDCTYYPCHDNNDINCLFCFCPLYNENHCKGEYKYIFINNEKVKDCSACFYPHDRKNYDSIIFLLSGKNKAENPE